MIGPNGTSSDPGPVYIPSPREASGRWGRIWTQQILWFHLAFGGAFDAEREGEGWLAFPAAESGHGENADSDPGAEIALLDFIIP